MKGMNLVKVELIDIDNNPATEYALIYADTYAEIGEQLDEFYGKDLISFSVEIGGKGYFRIAEDMVKVVKDLSCFDI